MHNKLLEKVALKIEDLAEAYRCWIPGKPPDPSIGEYTGGGSLFENTRVDPHIIGQNALLLAKIQRDGLGSISPKR